MYANKIRIWLNKEWKRVKGDTSDIEDPFDQETMPLLSPKSTYCYNVIYNVTFVTFLHLSLPLFAPHVF